MGVDQPVAHRQRQTLYTPAERARRDATVWTLVQGILAPLQFLAFAISLCLVINFLMNGVGFTAATACRKLDDHPRTMFPDAFLHLGKQLGIRGGIFVFVTDMDMHQ